MHNDTEVTHDVFQANNPGAGKYMEPMLPGKILTCIGFEI